MKSNKKSLDMAIKKLQTRRVKKSSLNKFCDLYIKMMIEEEIVERRKLFPHLILEPGNIFAPYIPLSFISVNDVNDFHSNLISGSSRYELRTISN